MDVKRDEMDSFFTVYSLRTETGGLNEVDHGCRRWGRRNPRSQSVITRFWQVPGSSLIGGDDPAKGNPTEANPDQSLPGSQDQAHSEGNG